MCTSPIAMLAFCAVNVIHPQLPAERSSGQSPATRGPAAQTDIQGIVKDLRSDVFEERAAAVDRAGRISPAQRGRELETALIGALEDLNQTWNTPNQPWHETGYPATLIRLVAESENPDAIPALVGALGTGRLASDGVAKFGELAVPQVLALARSGGWHVIAVHGALLTLTRMLDIESHGKASHPLSQESRDAIIVLTRDFLARRDAPVVLVATVNLAVATGDPKLRDTVRQLAEDPKAAREHVNLKGSESKLREAAQRALQRGQPSNPR